MNRKSPSLSDSICGRLHYAYTIVLVGTLTILGAQGFTRFGYSMLLPSMGDALQLSFAQMGLLATANFVGYALVSSVVGWVVGRWGFRLTIATGAITVGAAMFVTGTAQSYEVALALQFVAGLAGALAITPTMSLTTVWFVATRRGMAAGVVSSGGPFNVRSPKKCPSARATSGH